MSELPPLSDVAAARRYLASLPKSFRRRGEDYFRRGAVRNVACADAGVEYTADVLGTFTYQTDLVYEEGEWYGECSCPMQFDCKHVVALLYAVLGTDLNASAPPPVAKNLAAELTEALKRELTATEKKIATSIAAHFNQHRPWLTVTDWHLRQWLPQVRVRNWAQLTQWPHQPRTEVEFWQFLAFNLQKQGGFIPAWLMAVVDVPQIEKLYRDSHRQKEIKAWQTRLSSGSVGHGIASHSHPLDVRARLAGHRAQLDWRPTPTAPYEPLKPNRFKELANDYFCGLLELAPATASVWLAFYQLWERRRTATFEFHDDEVKRTMNILLRAPHLHEHVVGPTGLPFERNTAPLRWELQENVNDFGDVRLRLVDPTGLAAPDAWLVLPGRPTLFVTDTAIHTGPDPLPALRADRNHESTTMPKPVLESRAGIEMLLRLGVPLPAKLEQRIRRVTLTVKINVALQPTYPGATTESAFITVTATGAGREEKYVSGGWQDWSEGKAAKNEVVIYNRAVLDRVPATLAPLGLKWNNFDQCWTLRVTKNFPETFTAWLATVPVELEVYLDPALATLRDPPVSGTVRLDCEEAGVDWFDLQVVLDLKDTTLTKDEVRALLDARGKFVRVGKSGWRRLQFNLTEDDNQRLAELGLSPHDFSSEPQRLHALQLADKAAARFLPAERVQEIRRRVTEIQTRVMPPLPATVQAQLRPYQVAGFHFLAYLATNHFGGVLADDMGLGKTLQTLTWLAWLQQTSAGKPTLVVCPKSVTDNWRAEAERFVPGLRVHIWHGTNGAALLNLAATLDVVVINYTQLRALADALARQKWLAVILDEGQYIKNPTSQTAKAARALKSDYRLVLTGTPIENRLLDLWSLMSFAMPGVLGPQAQFSRQFDNAGDPLARLRLAARVRPFLLRRTKTQVAPELPDRVEEDLLCEMEAEQRTLYRAELKHAQQMLLKVQTTRDFDRERFNFLTSLLRLRQICCHPALVAAGKSAGTSAKVEALVDVLEPLMAEGQKVLVFSQFVTLIELIQPVLAEHGWKQFVLTGATENRGDLVKEFQQSEGAAVFLISLKAGGFGLNLTAASYVVLFDPWWNPAVENQAIDRTHRIGQERKVMAYRLLIKDSIEEKIRKLQRTKSALAQDVLGEERFAQGLSLDDLKFLLTDDSK